MVTTKDMKINNRISIIIETDINKKTKKTIWLVLSCLK